MPVPSRVWGSAAALTPSAEAEAFAESAGIETQKFLCYYCTTEGTLEPPTEIILHGGTSVCASHVSHVV